MARGHDFNDAEVERHTSAVMVLAREYALTHTIRPVPMGIMLIIAGMSVMFLALGRGDEVRRLVHSILDAFDPKDADPDPAAHSPDDQLAALDAMKAAARRHGFR